MRIELKQLAEKTEADFQLSASIVLIVKRTGAYHCVPVIHKLKQG